MTLRIQGMAPLIQVFDMRRSVSFYCEVLGFALISQSREGEEFDWCLLRLESSDSDDENVELMLNTAYEAPSRPDHPDPNRIAYHEDTGFFFGCEDLDAAFDHLRAHHVDATAPKTAPYGMRQIWLKDPDGYVICLQSPAK